MHLYYKKTRALTGNLTMGNRNGGKTRGFRRTPQTRKNDIVVPFQLCLKN